MSNVLVISGHPDLDQSNTNTVILEQLTRSLNHVSLRRLDTLYPNYRIDVAAEQQALLDADIIVLQFPFYWYSVPALLKKWIDDVLAYDFAYGSRGDKLKGKDFLLSFTIGGPEESYKPLGYNHFSIEQLLRPLEQTAYLAGMTYHPPIYSHGMVFIPGVYNTLEGVQTLARNHAQYLIQRVSEIGDSVENKVRRFVADWFEQFDQLPENADFFTSRLADDVIWKMPQGEFKGHSGFLDWYAIARKTFKPNCDHQVEQIEVIERSDHIQIDLRVRMFADTFADSELKGESINLLVNETWKASVTAANDITIFDYDVVPVVNQ